MTMFAYLNSLFRNLFRKPRLERDLDDEICSHLELMTDQKIKEGMNPQEAARAARIELGGIAQVKEEVRAVRAGAWLETLWQDICFGVRMLRKNPAFTAVAVLTLALGIGANTAIFSVVNTVLLHSLPYPQPNRIVQLGMSVPANPNFSATSVPKYMLWREQTQAFEITAVYGPDPYPMNVTGGDRPGLLTGMHVSASYFLLFGARAGQGRTFTPEEDVPHGPRLAVISSDLWRNRYGGDPGMVGKNIEVSGEPYQVIGILDMSFRWEVPIDVWLPLQADPNSLDQSNNLAAAGRLRPGVSLEQAKAATNAAYEEFRRKFPDAEAGLGFTSEPLQDDQVTGVRLALLLLVGAVAFVLLIACANVANLQLARAATRVREIAVRAALGAGRGRIIRQLLTEGLLLSMVGGALGLALGYFGVHALLRINPGDIPRIGEKGADVTMDWRVLGFTFAVSFLTGILFGLLPAIPASRTDLRDSLRDSGSRSDRGVRENKARAVLVVTEMALALMLMAGSALLIRTYIALRAIAPGFEPHNILTMDMWLDGPRFQKTAGVVQLAQNGIERIQSLPGVEAAATTSSVPLGPTYHDSFTIEGRPIPIDGYHGASAWRSISPNYFKVFRIPLHRGRSFDDRDSAAAPFVVLINETMATKFWPNDDPIGARITIDKGDGPPFEQPPRQIVGVVADVRDDEENRSLFPTMYIPLPQIPDGLTALLNQNLPMMWVVRAKVAPNSLSTGIQRELRSASGGLTVGHLRPMEQVISESTARSDFNTTLMTIFAAVALFLGALGVYGLIAYSVQQRKQEIGIRMALGASANQVRNLLVRQSMTLALAGTVIGIGAAWGLSRFMESLLFGAKARDPVVFLVAPVILTTVALLASYIPARRAIRIEPMKALRHE